MNKLEQPVSDWAHIKEKGISVQGYQLERKIMRFLKEQISHKDLKYIKKNAFPSLKNRIRGILSVGDFLIDLEFAIQNVKVKTLQKIWDDLSDSSTEISNDKITSTLEYIFKASHRRDDEEV